MSTFQPADIVVSRGMALHKVGRGLEAGTTAGVSCRAQTALRCPPEEAVPITKDEQQCFAEAVFCRGGSVLQWRCFAEAAVFCRGGSVLQRLAARLLCPLQSCAHYKR